MRSLKNILVHVDTRRDEQELLSRAAELAKLHGAALKIVDIVPEFSWPAWLTTGGYDEVRAAATKQKQQAVEELAAALKAKGINATFKVLSGRTSDQIIAEVVEGKHDLVMKDAKGQFSPQPGAFGATAIRLMRYCPCPVWAFRSRHSSGEDKIAIAVDATSTDDVHAALNREILDWASAIAGNSPLHVVHAWSVYGESLIKDYMKKEDFESLVRDAEREAREKMQKLLEPLRLPPDRVHVHLLRGDPSQELIQFVNSGGYDALILGTVARTGISGFLMGNTAETLFNRVDCSLIAIKPVDFKTPIAV